MPTIADYLDNSPKRDVAIYQMDRYYLYAPRTIVKVAEDEPYTDESGTTWLPPPGSDAIVWDRPTESSLSGVVSRGFISNMANKVQDPEGNTGTSALPYYTNLFFGGKDTPLIDWINKATNIVDWLNRVHYANRKGAKLYSVAGRSLLQGDNALPQFLDTVIPEEYRTDEFKQGLTQMYNLASGQGHFFVNPDTIGSQLLNAGNTLGLANPDTKYLDDGGYGSYYETPEAGWDDTWVEEYNNGVYTPEVVDHDYEDNFGGFFKDKAWQTAARYATPWLAYGVPLSTIGSLMGTNALWGPTLLGALGFGAYGYGVGSGALEDFSNSQFGQMLDTVHTTMNKPIGRLWNMLDPNTGRVANRMLTEPRAVPVEEKEPEAQPQDTTPPDAKPTSVTTYNTRFGPQIYRQGNSIQFKAPALLQSPQFPEIDTGEFTA